MKHLDYIVYNVHAVELEFAVGSGKYFVVAEHADEDACDLYKLQKSNIFSFLNIIYIKISFKFTAVLSHMTWTVMMPAKSLRP